MLGRTSCEFVFSDDRFPAARACAVLRWRQFFGSETCVVPNEEAGACLGLKSTSNGRQTTGGKHYHHVGNRMVFRFKSCCSHNIDRHPPVSSNVRVRSRRKTQHHVPALVSISLPFVLSAGQPNTLPDRYHILCEGCNFLGCCVRLLAVAVAVDGLTGLSGQ